MDLWRYIMVDVKLDKDMGHRMLFMELESFSGKDSRIYIGGGIMWSLSLEFQLGVREFHFDFWPIFGTSSNMFLSHQSCDVHNWVAWPIRPSQAFCFGGGHAQPSAGIHTKVAQVVALSLGCPLDVIRVADTNSEALRPHEAMWSGVGACCFFLFHASTFSEKWGWFTWLLWNDTTVMGKNCTKFSEHHPKYQIFRDLPYFFEFPKSLTRWCQMHDSLVDPLPPKSFAKQQDRCGIEILGGRLPSGIFLWGGCPKDTFTHSGLRTLYSNLMRSLVLHWILIVLMPLGICWSFFKTSWWDGLQNFQTPPWQPKKIQHLCNQNTQCDKVVNTVLRYYPFPPSQGGWLTCPKMVRPASNFSKLSDLIGNSCWNVMGRSPKRVDVSFLDPRFLRCIHGRRNHF